MSLLSGIRARQTIGNYTVLQKIAEGGMGTVYKGRSQATGDLVAIKVLAAELVNDRTRMQRFEQEFWATLQLDHPNLVRALDFGKDERIAYMVMEFVDGPSLGQRIDREGRLAEAEAVRIISQVAQALYYAHQRNMIHRDVKPDNILLRSDGQAKLTDLGLVKDVGEDLKLTRPSIGMGTPHFMAPEQYTDAKQVDFRCDIYSLGATLYTAVTGVLPFADCGSLEALSQKVTGAISPPRRLVPALSETVDRLIRRAMDPDPAKRPASCLEFVKELTGKHKPQIPPPAAADRQPLAPPVESMRPKGKNRRAAVRYRCTVAVSCTMPASFHPDAQATEESWPATIQDISTGGMGLLLARRFEPATIVQVAVENTDTGSSRSLSLRVNHVKPEGLGHWLHGCSFLEPVSPEELKQLL